MITRELCCIKEVARCADGVSDVVCVILLYYYNDYNNNNEYLYRYNLCIYIIILYNIIIDAVVAVMHIGQLQCSLGGP